MYVISQILLSIPITDEITDLILTYILDIHITCNMFFDKCAPKIYIPQACKWQVKKLPEKFSAQKLRHIESRVCYKQNIN